MCIMLAIYNSQLVQVLLLQKILFMLKEKSMVFIICVELVIKPWGVLTRK